MNKVIQLLRSRRVGLALSGGSVRGLVHIGVIKALAELGIRPAVIAGTSAGSIVGAGLATAFPSKQAFTITEGHLASAISASCALRVIRHPVVRAGQHVKDGGIACVLPALACCELGAEFVIASDVWELSSLLRGMGRGPTSYQSLARWIEA